jgi:serine/threonine protein phosphatase PrpC
MLTAFGLSHIGHVRKTNEDSFFWDPDLGLFIVADGMGGHNAGEVASQLAVDAIRGFFARTALDEDITWPFGINPTMSLGANRLTTSIKLANRRVFRLSESRDALAGMGTTVVVVLVEGDHLVYCGVGDSRIYSYLGGRLTQLTADDSWIATVLLESGLDEMSLTSHPMRNLLTNVVGAKEDIEFEVFERSLEPGEVLLLSSDGLHGSVADAAIQAAIHDAIETQSPLEDAAARLVERALDSGGRDNVTVLLVQSRTSPDDRQVPVAK